MAKRMPRHYDAWLASGMSRAAYARQHGINNNTFWYLCRALSADDSRGPAPTDVRPAILPVSITVSDTATPKLQLASITSIPAGINTLTRLATQAAGHSPREGEVFHWPRDGDTIWSLTVEQFTWLTAGVDWLRFSAGPSRYGLNEPLCKYHNISNLLSGCSCPYQSSWQHDR
ncbi:IS66 family insertion sequence element accessory protein TnpA [Escherichia coli]|uniref:IS66 family insertion sequence element accessory protein TnpA n=1 Tax=Escherichia coli TaxID=562 RepID=UPI000DA5872E|nr:hypothetical protein [Escherichia coli]MCT6058226.1 hypothetical protein [Escherichia coli]SQM12239.1 Uncharacterised protein [Escherichia coli]SQM26861.1 Uncharacterised protein [Escherichia coli]